MKDFQQRGAESTERQAGEGDLRRHCGLTAKELKLRYNPQRDFAE